MLCKPTHSSLGHSLLGVFPGELGFQPSFQELGLAPNWIGMPGFIGDGASNGVHLPKRCPAGVEYSQLGGLFRHNRVLFGQQWTVPCRARWAAGVRGLSEAAAGPGSFAPPALDGVWVVVELWSAASSCVVTGLFWLCELCPAQTGGTKPKEPRKYPQFQLLSELWPDLQSTQLQLLAWYVCDTCCTALT